MNARGRSEYIAGVEAADADTFAELLLEPRSDEETAILRTHLGNALHQRLHRLATRQRITHKRQPRTRDPHRGAGNPGQPAHNDH